VFRGVPITGVVNTWCANMVLVEIFLVSHIPLDSLALLVLLGRLTALIICALYLVLQHQALQHQRLLHQPLLLHQVQVLVQGTAEGLGVMVSAGAIVGVPVLGTAVSMSAYALALPHQPPLHQHPLQVQVLHQVPPLQSSHSP